MLKQFAVFLVIALWGGNVAIAQQKFTVGGYEIGAPDGWQVVKKDDGMLQLGSPDEKQMLTISPMHFETGLSPEDFKKLCDEWINTGKKAYDNKVVIVPEHPEPHKDKNAFVMTFGGHEEKTGLKFSRYLTAEQHDFVTIYLESMAADDEKVHEATFQGFVASLKSAAH